MSNASLAALKKASHGLSYMSEKDAPYTTFSWKKDGKLTKKKVLELGKQPPDSPIEEVSQETFFAALIKDQQWHGKEEKAVVEKNRHLLEVIRENLSEVKVFKVGQTKKIVYIVGTDKESNWSGLATYALET